MHRILQALWLIDIAIEQRKERDRPREKETQETVGLNWQFSARNLM